MKANLSGVEMRSTQQQRTRQREQMKLKTQSLHYVYLVLF